MRVPSPDVLANGAAVFVLGVMLAGAASASTVKVFANNEAPGDSFTFSGAIPELPSGEQVTGTDWYYTNVRAGGTVGINDTLPRAGNGSVFMSTAPTSPGTTTLARADIAFMPGATPGMFGGFVPSVNPGDSLGLFSALTSMSYEWYRMSSSTNEAWQHPALRVLLGVPDGNDGFATGALVFERAYGRDGTPSTAGIVSPVDQWVSDEIDGDTFLWSQGALPEFGPSEDRFGSSLSAWQGFLPEDTFIAGFSAAVGSGWGFFEGAVDNISWTIGESSLTSNFELRAPDVIPLPAAGWLLLSGLGLFGAMAARRRKAG